MFGASEDEEVAEECGDEVVEEWGEDGSLVKKKLVLGVARREYVI